jgi:hypothetical protein
MKKLLIAFQCIGVVLSASGCGGAEDTSAPEEPAGITATAPGPTESTTTSTTTSVLPSSTEAPTTSEPRLQTTTTTPSPTAKSPSTTTPTAIQLLPDGEYFVFVSQVDVSSRSLQVDLAELFTGPQAQEESAKDGEVIDADFYIRNSNSATRTLTVSTTPSIKVLAGGADLVSSDLAGLKHDVDAQSELPARLWLVGNEVRSVEVVFFP